MTRAKPNAQRGGAREGAGRKRELHSARNGGVRTTAFLAPDVRERLDVLLAEADQTLGQFLTDAVERAERET